MARKSNRGRVGAVIVAAGKGQRMGGVNKVFAPVLGRPLLAYTVEAFQQCSTVDSIALVLHPQSVERGRALCHHFGWTKVVSICQGGERRQDSVKNGLAALPACEWVIIHDGARPCVEPALIERGLEEAKATGAAVAAVPVKDTVKFVGTDGMVQSTPPRDQVWMVQTPQVFRYQLITRAYEDNTLDVSDDAMLIEHLGHSVKVFMGSYSNIKVTTPEDLALAEFLLQHLERGRK